MTSEEVKDLVEQARTRSRTLGSLQDGRLVSELATTIEALQAELAEAEGARIINRNAIKTWQERSEATEAELVKLREGLEFYRGAWNCKPNKRYGGLEWSPKEELLDDCGNRARALLNPQGEQG